MPSHGALALAGGVSFVIGALLLFDPAGDGYQVSIWVALAVGGTLALVTAIVITKVVARAARARRRPAGRRWSATSASCAARSTRPGLVNVHGEIWKAHADGEPIAAGEYVRVSASATTSCSRCRASRSPQPWPRPRRMTLPGRKGAR